MEYPVLSPVPIKMKGLSFFMKIWTWLFCVRKWELIEGWKYNVNINGVGRDVFIEKGFVFDGASVPRILWWLLSPTGILLIPGIIHDYAYRHERIVVLQGKKNIKVKLFEYDRRYWDRLFRDISIEVNDSKIISYSAWIALYLFGGFAWRNNRKLDEVRAKEDWKKLAEKYKNFKA